MRFKRAIVFAAVFASIAGLRCEAQSNPTAAPGWNGPQPGAITPFGGGGQNSYAGGDLRPAMPQGTPVMNQGAPVMMAPVPAQTAPMMNGAPAQMKKHNKHTSVVGAAVGLPDRTAKTGLGMTDRTAKTGVGMVDRTAKTGVGLTDRAAKTTIGVPVKATKEVFKALF